MAMRLIALIFFIMCSLSADAQFVKLSRLERAGGAGYVPYTDANGKQGYSLLSTLLSGYVTGSGTTNRIAYWSSSSALTSTNWSINATSITNTGANSPYMSTVYGFLWSGDVATGMKRMGTNIVGMVAGHATNPIVTMNGSTALVTFDPNLDGTADVSISATTTSVEVLTASGTINANNGVKFPANSISNTTALLGTDATNLNTRVIIGDEFEWGDGGAYDTLKLSASTTAHLFAYDDNVGTSQTFSLTGSGTYDTIQLATTGQIEDGVTYGPPNPSTDSAIIFTYAGTYMVSLDFTGELSTAATNQTVRMRWNKNSGAAVNGTGVSYGFETTARQTYTQTFLITVAANDYIQLMVTPGTGGAATLTVVTPKIVVEKIK